MNDKAQLEVSVLGAAVFMGVLGDALLRTNPWGLNFLLWMGALMAALVVLARWKREALGGDGCWLGLPTALFSIAFLWRDSPALKMLSILALLAALSLVMLRAQGGRIGRAGLIEYALGSAIAGLNAAFGIVPLLFGETQWKNLFGDRWPTRALAVARGLLFSVPVLLVFGGLFMLADAVFEGMVKKALHLDFRRLFTHFFVAAFFAWCVGGYLRGMLLGREFSTVAEKRPATPRLGIIEIGLVLGLLDLLFLGFVLVQIRYFFGGAPLVQATTGLTYAEYARRGFFELVTVAALSLPLLLFAHWLLAKTEPKAEGLFRFLAEAQIVLLFVIMASAFQRMRLYQAEYGLTEQRFYPTAFMGWLAIVFVWFAGTVLSGRRERFAVGATVAGFLLLAVLNVWNPDAFIARTNAARAAAGRSFDVRYATSLSADAVPELIAALPALSPQDRCAVSARLRGRWSPTTPSDWRAWSWSRAKAWRAVRENEAALQAATCAEQKK